MIGPRTSKPSHPRKAPREGEGSRSPCASVSSVSSVVKDIPFPRHVLVDAARLRARDVEWEAVAEKTGADVSELVTFSIDHPEVWGPLYERAEKLRLAEAEGETIKGLCTLLKGDDEVAAENAAKELLIHRRHVERRRYGGSSRAKLRDLGIRISECGTEQSAIRDPQSAMAAEGASKYPEWLVEDPAPAELGRRITYAANRVAHGDDYHRIARETGQDEVEVLRWAFIYAKAWDKAYPTARRTAAQAGASRAVNRLLDFVVSPDLKQAARAGRLLLVHRRHMHWANQPQRTQSTQGEELGPRETDVRESVINSREHKVSPDTGSSVSSVSSVVKEVLPRPRDGPYS